MYLKRFFGAAPSPHPCAACEDDQSLDFEIAMAFQPIVSAPRRDVFAYEALVRGTEGQPAGEVIAQVRPEQLYRFDQTCRVKAIETAAALGMQTRLSINFFPNAVYQPATCIRLTLAAAAKCGFPTSRLIFEMAESERVVDQAHVTKIFRDYQSRGFLTAIDDFGAGYAGLTLLADHQPDMLKLDMALVRGIEHSAAKLAIVRGVAQMASELECAVVAEGVETVEEYRALRGVGICLYQGYLFGHPVINGLHVPPDGLWEWLDHDLA